MYKEYKSLEQGTDDWFTVRQLKLTASKASAIGTAGKGLETLTSELVYEHFSTAPREHYSNEHTERGNELEASARFIYEQETNATVEQIGFAELNENVGCSPDGLVGDKGLLEIKCPSDKIFYHTVMNKKIDKGYMWQMQMQMLVMDREWCDYMVYNPNYSRTFWITRVERDDEMIKKLEDGFEKGIGQIKIKVAEMQAFLNQGGNNE